MSAGAARRPPFLRTLLCLGNLCRSQMLSDFFNKLLSMHIISVYGKQVPFQGLDKVFLVTVQFSPS